MRGIRRELSWKTRLLAAALILAIVLVSADALLRPALCEVARNRASQMATGEIAQAVKALQDSRPSLFEGLTHMNESADGIRSLEVDTAAANRLKNEVSLAVMAAFDEARTQSLSIPLGTLSGWQLLSGAGPEIHVGAQLNGAVSCDFRSEFSSGGINQTIHRLTLTVTVDIAVLLPFYTSAVRCQTEFLVAETVLLGETPGVYLGTK